MSLDILRVWLAAYTALLHCSLDLDWYSPVCPWLELAMASMYRPAFMYPSGWFNSSLTDLRKYEQYASTASLRASDLDLERRGHEMTWSWLVNCVHESWPCVFRHLAHPAIEFFPGGREAKREPRAQAIANKAHRDPQHQ